MGRLVYDLGNLYLIPGHSRFNGHALVDVLRAPTEAFAEQRALWDKLRLPDESVGETYTRLIRTVFSGESESIDAETIQQIRRSFGGNGLLIADADSFRQAIQQVDEILAPLNQADMQRADRAVIEAEFRLAGDFIKHSARRGLFLLGEDGIRAGELHQELEGLIARYRENWLARNRPGGLDDSAARFNIALDSYQ